MLKKSLHNNNAYLIPFRNNSIPALEKINEIEKYKKDIYFEPKNILIHVKIIIMLHAYLKIT